MQWQNAIIFQFWCMLLKKNKFEKEYVNQSVTHHCHHHPVPSPRPPLPLLRHHYHHHHYHHHHYHHRYRRHHHHHQHHHLHRLNYWLDLNVNAVGLNRDPM